MQHHDIKGDKFDLETLKGMTRENAVKLLHVKHPGINLQYYSEQQSNMFCFEVYYNNTVRLMIDSVSNKVLDCSYH